jgi:hypothetical protein
VGRQNPLANNLILSVDQKSMTIDNIYLRMFTEKVGDIGEGTWQ